MTLHDIVFITGALVWALGGGAVVLVALALLLPGVWKELCYQGYSAFAERTTKDALRKAAQEIAAKVDSA